MYNQPAQYPIVWQRDSAVTACFCIFLGLLFSLLIYCRIKTKDRILEIPLIFGLYGVTVAFVIGTSSWSSFVFTLGLILCGGCLGYLSIKLLHNPRVLNDMGLRRVIEESPAPITEESTVNTTSHGVMPW